jgi:cation diffusion facilitator family transporter
LLIEGATNLSVCVVKLVVGFTTGSAAILSDAIHSFADLANNGVAFLAIVIADAPPDREHPYGHRKFETLVLFGLATLLAVLAVEIALRSLGRSDHAVIRSAWGLGLMLGVLVVNVAITLWEGYWAHRLDSEILRADARHTFADVLITIAVITGWQFAAMGHAWLDTVATLGVAMLVLYLAWGLFRRAIPVLVDSVAVNPDELEAIVASVPGVRSTRRIRSRSSGAGITIDVTVGVDPDLSTQASHAISEEIERALAAHFSNHDVTIHVEPEIQEESTP